MSRPLLSPLSSSLTIAATPSAAPLQAAPPLAPMWRRKLRKFVGHHGLTLGVVVLVLIILTALFAPWLAPHDPYGQDVTQRLIPPVWHANALAPSHILASGDAVDPPGKSL